MTCTFDKEKLTGYFDGELGTAEKAEVEKHISACSECLRDLAELKSAAQLVRSLPRGRAPASVAEAVARELATAGRVHSFARYRKAVLWTFAAAAGLLVVANVAYFAGAGRLPAPAAGLAESAPAASEVGRITYKDGGAAPAERRKDLSERALPAQDEAPRRRQTEKANDALRAENGAAAKMEPKPGAAFGAKSDAPKDGLLRGAKEQEKDDARALGQAPSPKPAEAPPAARAPESKPLAEELKKSEKAEAPAAAAPAPPPAPGKAPVEKESQQNELLALKEAKAGADLQKQKADDGGGPSLRWTCAASKPAAARAKAEEILAKKGWASTAPAVANAAPEKKAAALAEPERAGGKPPTLTVELTAAQFAELKKLLEAQEGVALVAGTPDEANRQSQMRGQGGGLAGGGAGQRKAGDDPAKPEGQSKGAPTPEREEAAKADAKRAKSAGPGLDETRDRESGEKGKAPTGADKAPVAGRTVEPRQKYVLYFLETPSEKK